MPVYTLNPSHKRSGSHKASRSPSLRERMTMRRNPLSEDGAVVSNPNVMGNAIIWTPAGEGAYHGEILVSHDGGRRTQAPYMASVKRASGGWDWLIIGWVSSKPLASGHAASLREAQKAAGAVAVPSHHMNPRRNPLSEDGMVVNPRRKNGFVLVYLPGHQGRKMAIRDANSRDVQKGEALTYEEAMRIAKLNGAEDVVDQSSHATSPRNNPRRKGAAKRSGSRTAAQGNAAKAMKLYHSGQASSLAEAWQMVRGSSARRNPLSEDGMVVSNPRAKTPTRRNGVFGPTVHSSVAPAVVGRGRYRLDWVDHGYDGRLMVELYGDGKFLASEDTYAEVGTPPAELDRLARHLLNRLRLPENPQDFVTSKQQGFPAWKRGTHPKYISYTEWEHNPLSEDGTVVSNPRRKGSKSSAKRSGGRTAAQGNAAKAMKLFHSGQASSLAEAWDMVRRGR